MLGRSSKQDHPALCGKFAAARGRKTCTCIWRKKTLSISLEISHRSFICSTSPPKIGWAILDHKGAGGTPYLCRCPSCDSGESAFYKFRRTEVRIILASRRVLKVSEKRKRLGPCNFHHLSQSIELLLCLPQLQVVISSPE